MKVRLVKWLVAPLIMLPSFFFFVSQTHADEVTYRYIKWQIVQKREAANCAGSACIQVGEFQLMRNGTPVAWPDGATVSNPGGSNPPSEGYANAIDGDTGTKWLDYNFNADYNQTTGSSVLVIDAGTDMTFDGYRFATANDSLDRDPIGWNMYGSSDGSAWTLIGSAADQDITEGRLTYTSFPLGDVAGTYYAGGNGTADSPYQISTCRQLQRINYNTSADFKLINDIYCDANAPDSADDTSTWSPGYFTPISSFSGTLDGQLFGIYGVQLGINDLGGLFAGIEGGTVRNLNLYQDGYGSVVSTSGWSVGSLAGYASGATIENVTSDMIIRSEADDIGGLIGYTDNSEGENIIASSTFSGTIYVTTLSPSTITNIGGLVGSLNHAQPEGVTGTHHLMFDGSIVINTPDAYIIRVGGITGYLQNSSASNFIVGPHAHISITASGVSQIGGVIGMTQYMANVPTDISVESGAVLSITASDDGASYIGGVVGDLGIAASRLTTDADLSVTVSGTAYSIGGVAGNFREDNNTLSQSHASSTISINHTGTSSIESVGALVGSASASNLTISDSYAISNLTVNSGGPLDQVGGLIGFGNNLTLERSYYDGTLHVSTSASDDGYIEYLGGFIGRADYSTIRDTFATGLLTASSTGNTFGLGARIGGFSGQSIGGNVSRSYVAMPMILEGLSSTVGRTYEGVGGFMGFLWSGSVADSFVVGSTTFIGPDASDSLAGGFIGSPLSNPEISNSVYVASPEVTCAAEEDREGCSRVSSDSGFMSSYGSEPFNDHGATAFSQKWSLRNSVWNPSGTWDVHYSSYPTLYGLPDPYSSTSGALSIAFTPETAANNEKLSSSPVTVGLSITSPTALVPTYSFINLDDSLKGWWKFNGSVSDSSGSANNTTLTGTETYLGGVFGGGIFLDGSTYMSLERPVKDSFTICAWISTKGVGVNNYHYTLAPIFESETPNVAPDFGFGINNDGNAAFGTGGDDETGRDVTIAGTVPVNDGNWHYLCAVRNVVSPTSADLSLYVDNTKVAEGTNGGESLDSNPEARIGAATDGGGTFVGLIDELIVFGRALGTDELAALYDGSNGHVNKDFAVIDGVHTFAGVVSDSLGTSVASERRSVTVGSVSEDDSTDSHGETASVTVSKTRAMPSRRHPQVPVVVQEQKPEVVSPVFTLTLKAGMTNKEVILLQKFLNAAGFLVAGSGAGSPGHETSYFGALTKSALIKFQEAHAKDILKPVGLTKGTGIFGPSTQSFIANSKMGSLNSL